MGQLSRTGCPTEPLGLPVIREMQVQATRSSHFPPNQMGNKSKSQVIPSSRKATEQELVGQRSHSLGGPAGTEDPARIGCAPWNVSAGSLSQLSMQRLGNAVLGMGTGLGGVTGLHFYL